MKHYSLVAIILSLILLAACTQQTSQPETRTTTEKEGGMEAVVINTTPLNKEESVSDETTTTKEGATTEITKEKEPKEDYMKLLQKYGEAYANFKSINQRNEKLKDLMTEECIKMNGIDIKTGNGLGSEGKVTSIYQNDKDEYAVLLDCIQNGSPIRILLLTKVENGKIAKMTYNTLKQEY